MFSIMAHNRRRGWQNLEKKIAFETVDFQNFVTLGADFKGHNWSRLIMFYVIYPNF